MSKMQWFRLYGRIIDDDRLRLLAFEDRWHFVALCCLKLDGLLDEPDSDLKTRRIAVKMGVQLRELEELGRRLREVGLVDEALNPVAWDDLQFKSENSAERVRKYREKRKANGLSSGSEGYQKHHAALMMRDGGACVYCRSKQALCIDHMVPVTLGGTDDIDNLAIACKSCNSGKAGRTPEQAGYKIQSKQAAIALSRYVTVTVTAQETETDTETSNEVKSVCTDPPLSEAEVVEAWNSRMVPQGFPAVKRLTPERKRKLKARLRENTIDDWQQAMAALERSAFCRGENGRGWRADFDFLLQPKSFTKLLEGAYEPAR